MEINEKFRKLVDLLHAKTLKDELEWNAAADGGAIVRIADRWISIEKFDPDFEDPYVKMIIFGSDAQIVDTFTDNDLNRFAPSNGANSYYELMDDLHSRALVKAKGVNESLDAILSALDDDVPF